MARKEKISEERRNLIKEFIASNELKTARDVEDALKTPAMFNVLNFIWAKVRAIKKQRLLVCDEAWIMLQNEISANFLFGLIKRARKYGL